VQWRDSKGAGKERSRGRVTRDKKKKSKKKERGWTGQRSVLKYSSPEVEKSWWTGAQPCFVLFFVPKRTSGRLVGGVSEKTIINQTEDAYTKSHTPCTRTHTCLFLCVFIFARRRKLDPANRSNTNSSLSFFLWFFSVPPKKEVPSFGQVCWLRSK
jgi:hypothetical protein